MGDPTLKDVLDAIARLEKGQAELRAETATKKDLGAFESRVNKRFDHVDAALVELDDELARHSDTTHRKLEADIARLKAKPAKVTARAPHRR